MAEEKKQVVNIRVDFKCPMCVNGYLRPMGTVFTTNPPMIPHKCNNPSCDYGETFNVAYPYMDKEEIPY
jgi:hypothetical protein